MRKMLLAFLAPLLGCGGKAPTVSGGNPDSPDAGVSCDNQIIDVPLERVPDGTGRAWSHIDETQIPVYVNNPPVNGEHYGASWGRWQIFSTEARRGYWVHNLEHGGVILLYRKAADGLNAPQSVIDALMLAYNKIEADHSDECVSLGLSHKRVVMTPDHLLPSDLPWAVVVAGPEALGLGHMVKGACVDADFIKAFAERYRGQARETRCDNGDYGG